MIIGLAHGPTVLRRRGILGPLPSGQIRDLLTTSLAAWDAATPGEGILVTEAEYQAVRAAQDVSWYVQSPADAENPANATNWSVNWTISYGDETYPEAVVPGGQYILGFMVARALTMSNGVTVTTFLKTSTTSANTGFTTLAQPSFVKSTFVTGVQRLYFLIKNPPSATTGTTWLAHHQRDFGSLAAVANKTNYPIFYTAGNASTASTRFTGPYPVFQVIATPNTMW